MNERPDNRRADDIDDPARARGHELRDLGLRGLLAGMALLAGLLLGAWASMGILFGVLSDRESRDAAPPSALSEPASPPQPRLETEPGALLERLRRNEDELLHEYAWLDRDAGTVRIPIDRAMEIIAERGLPAVEPGSPEAAEGGGDGRR